MHRNLRQYFPVKIPPRLTPSVLGVTDLTFHFTKGPNMHLTIMETSLETNESWAINKSDQKHGPSCIVWPNDVGMLHTLYVALTAASDSS